MKGLHERRFIYLFVFFVGPGLHHKDCKQSGHVKALSTQSWEIIEEKVFKEHQVNMLQQAF